MKNYHSSSSSFFPVIAASLCRNASARPPARPLPLSLGVLVPVPALLLPPEYPLSLGAGGGAGLLPLAAGRFAGGAGGAGFALAPFVVDSDRAAGAGGGGGGAGAALCSSKYAEGTHPEADPSCLLPSHHPLPSLFAIMIISSFFRLISACDWPLNSYIALNRGSEVFGAGGGGGGGARPPLPLVSSRLCLTPFIAVAAAAEGWGIDFGCEATGCGIGLGCMAAGVEAAGRDAAAA